METPWTRARTLRHDEQEKRVGRMPESTQQVNSGRFWRWKRDAKVWNFLVEARTTEKASYRIDKKEFQDIRKQAITTPPGLKPGMQVDIQDLSLWVMGLDDWEAVYTRIIELEARLEELQGGS